MSNNSTSCRLSSEQIKIVDKVRQKYNKEHNTDLNRSQIIRMLLEKSLKEYK